MGANACDTAVLRPGRKIDIMRALVMKESTTADQLEAPARSEQNPRGFFGEVREILKVLLISLAIVLPIRYFIAQPFIVSGASMQPNFEDREYLIVDELTYHLRSPERGEPIIFRFPKNPSQFYIKRVIGLPGETVAIVGGKVRIWNSGSPEGFTLDESYLGTGEISSGPELRVELGDMQYFVLGDNRDSSSDSRIWGPLGKELIVGRAFFRVWPVTKFGAIPSVILDTRY